MQPKQTSQETLTNVKALVEFLKEKGKQLILIDEARRDPSLVDQRDFNVSLIDSYMLAHFTEKTSGLTDYSFTNLKKAVSALKQNLHWVAGKAPKQHVPDIQHEHNRISRETSNVTSNAAKFKAGEDERAAEVEARHLHRIEHICKTHTSHPHARTFEQRAELQKEFEKLKRQKLKAAQIEPLIRAKIDAFFRDSEKKKLR